MGKYQIKGDSGYDCSADGRYFTADYPGIVRERVLRVFLLMVAAGVGCLAFSAYLQEAIEVVGRRVVGAVNQDGLGRWSDPNYFAALFVVGLPVLWHLGFALKNRFARLACWLVIPLALPVAWVMYAVGHALAGLAPAGAHGPELHGGGGGAAHTAREGWCRGRTGGGKALVEIDRIHFGQQLPGRHRFTDIHRNPVHASGSSRTDQVAAAGFDYANSKQHRRQVGARHLSCLLYTSPSPRDRTRYRMPSSA